MSINKGELLICNCSEVCAVSVRTIASGPFADSSAAAD